MVARMVLAEVVLSVASLVLIAVAAKAALSDLPMVVAMVFEKVDSKVRAWVVLKVAS